jgi:C4-dicarboxylate-specific signal transduction histidine kinase
VADELRRELTHLSRVETMGALSGALAHELNQPLAAILSNAQAARRFLAMEPAQIDEVREALEDIMLDDERAGHVIQRLRACSSARRPRPSSWISTTPSATSSSSPVAT